MNVKELRQKLEKIPDDAAVRFVSVAEDNLTNDYYDTETAIYVERLERDGMKAVYFSLRVKEDESG